MSLLDNDLKDIITEGKIQAGMLSQQTNMSQEDIQKLLVEGKIQAAMLQEDKKEITQEDIQKMLSEGKIAAAILNQQEQEKLSNELTQKDIERYKQQRLQNLRATANEGGKFPDLNEDGKITQADILKGRGIFQEGGSMDDQMMMVMSMPDKPMESDDTMEDNYTQFIMEEALNEEEEDMLTSKLEQDKELQMLFDKIIDVAQEFAGSGPVEGPGSGVSDSIPARLSDGEFVFTAKAVDEIGADNLMAMMKDAEMKADDRQGLAEGGQPEEEETVEMPVEKPASKQDIRVVKTTVDNGGKGIMDEDEISKSIKSKMMLDNRTGRHVQS